MMLKNIFRLKSLKTKKVFWIVTSCSDYKEALVKKKSQEIELEADKAIRYPNQIILDKVLGQVDGENQSQQSEKILADILLFNPRDVMSQRQRTLYLCVTEGNVNKFEEIMKNYPQIDLGWIYDSSKLLQLNKKAHNIESTRNPMYWEAIASATDVLLRHSNDIKVIKSDGFIPFNVDIKADQDKKRLIFYREYYPTHFYELKNNPKYKSLTRLYEFSRGLKYKIEDEPPLRVDGRENDGRNKNYRICLEHLLDIKSSISNEELVSKAVDFYSKHLKSVLYSKNGSIILAALPAHNKLIKNIVSRIVEKLATDNDWIINGNRLIVKNADEVEAHNEVGMEGRNINTHLKSWRCDIRKENITNYVGNLPIVIIDDIATSGNSLIAADEYFEKLGFKHIYNFVFGKSTPSTSLIDEHATHKTYDGIIMDLDQTYYNSAYRNDNGVAKVYFEDLELKLKQLNVKIVFVTQTSKNNVLSYCDNDVNSFVMKNLFLTDKKYTTVKEDDVSFYKPSGYTITKAIEQHLSECHRILGIGNNENDIIAYRRAGIDTALATWGDVIINLKTTANYVIRNEDDLLAVLRDGISFLDKKDLS